MAISLPECRCGNIVHSRVYSIYYTLLKVTPPYYDDASDMMQVKRGHITEDSKKPALRKYCN